MNTNLYFKTWYGFIQNQQEIVNGEAINLNTLWPNEFKI